MEGLEYTVMDYYNPNNIENEELRGLVIETRRALENLQEFIDDYEAMR